MAKSQLRKLGYRFITEGVMSQTQLDNDGTVTIVWTDYMKYRAKLRGFDLAKIENIIRYSRERYFDTATGRRVVAGRYGNMLVAIPYEVDQHLIIPVTIHATTRQQIRFRIRTGRYTIE